MRVQTRVDVLCELGAVAADVDVGEGVAAEDVVEGFEGGGAVGRVVGQVVGGGEDLQGITLVGGDR